MKRSLGMLLLSIWLIAHGLVTLINLSFSGLFTGLALMALVSGILLLIGR